MNRIIKTSVGVELEIKSIPALAFRDISRKFERDRPKIPVVMIEAKGRKEENPNDPDYLAAMADWQDRQQASLYEAAIILCTSPKTIPPELPSPQADDWIEDLQIAGLDIPEGKKQRYIAWIKYVAAPTTEDINIITRQIMRVAGVSEEDVANAAGSFRTGEGRNPDPGAQPSGNGQHGDHDAIIPAGDGASL